MVSASLGPPYRLRFLLYQDNCLIRSLFPQCDYLPAGHDRGLDFGATPNQDLAVLAS
jgi:hypothetical protein